MNTETGEIRAEEDIPKKERKTSKWVQVLAGMTGALSAMSPDERLTQLRRERRSGVPHYFGATKPRSDSRREKKAKRKGQKLARRRNRR